jgi:hypothetical protein
LLAATLYQGNPDSSGISDQLIYIYIPDTGVAGMVLIINGKFKIEFISFVEKNIRYFTHYENYIASTFRTY